MAYQWLNSMYFRGQSQRDPVTGKRVMVKPDALIFTVKDTVTLKTEIKILPHPKIDFYLAKTPQPYHRFSMPESEVRTVSVPYLDREREIAACLGKLQDFYNSSNNRMEYNREIMRNPNLYSADTNIEDFYKTKTILANETEDGEQSVAPKYNMCYSDTEVDISRLDEDFPDPNQAPCPICLITAFYDETKEAISYILYDERTAEDQKWVVQHPNEFVNEYLDPIIKNEGFTFAFKLFNSELDMIKTYFSDMHVRKPDFCLWWNMAFDMPTIINRLKLHHHLSDDEIAEILCHPDIPKQFRYYKYIPDPNRTKFETSDDDDEEDDEKEEQSKNSKNKPHPSRLIDWVEIPGYTQHYCQMAMFSNIRKRSILPSYKLDVIGQEYAGIGKYNLQDNGYSIKDCNVKNFKIFLAYNIRDSFVQYMVEKKCQDINQYILSASNTRLSKGHQMSICVKNEIMLYLAHRHEVMGNAIDYGIFESFEGALVGKPDLLEQFGVNISGADKTFLYEDTIDLDASSLYPSLIIAFNIFKSALYGRIVNVYDGDKVIDKGDGLFADLQTIDQALFDICERYFKLPSPLDVVKAIESEATTKAMERFSA